jgi:ABC-type siderophore export system fused ATPase/permease subunit
MSLLVRCQRDLDRTIILVTHNLEYMPLADKLLHIEDGRVKEINEGSIKQTTDVLFADMRSRMHRLEKAQTDVK